MTVKPSVHISELTFSNGDVFQFEEKEKVVIVGANNSGKSQSLREILDLCGNGNADSKLVVTGLELFKKGTLDDLKSFLDDEAEYTGHSYRYKNWEIHTAHLNWWNHSYLSGGLLSGYIKNIDAKSRLSISEQQNSIPRGGHRQKPQHVLYDSEVLMKKISDIFKRAFGKELMIDFRGGSKIPIHVGDSPDKELMPDRVSDQYVDAVRKNPLLDVQGDGMKSYAGILFETLVNDLDITLIDEPEAFLHPPQMRRLGETLASEMNGQLFVATHSSDILRGFLEGAQGNIRILRISRENNVNEVKEASQDAIKELWEKPVLRYSNALEGIFHEQTIICEDDSDCRLINSVADHLELVSGKQWQDTAYVPTGGKDAIPKVAQVLRKIGVPIKAVFDIDFLSREGLVKETVEAFGGEWEQFQALWNRVDAEVRKGGRARSNEEIKSDLVQIIHETKTDELPKSKISDALKQTSEWSIVKKYGERGVPSGQATSNYHELKELLEAIGIYLVPEGEIENFLPEVGSHGPKFVTKLLSGYELSDPKLSGLRGFVEKVHEGSGLDTILRTQRHVKM